MEFKDFISIGALILSGISIVFAIRYARINVLHSIQKLVLDKSKDCNKLYAIAFEDWERRSKLVGNQMVDFNYFPVVNEIVISIQLLDSSLIQFKHFKLRGFFIKQFWIQLDVHVRMYIKGYVVPEGIDSMEIRNTLSMQKAFQHLFDKY